MKAPRRLVAQVRGPLHGVLLLWRRLGRIHFAAGSISHRADGACLRLGVEGTTAWHTAVRALGVSCPNTFLDNPLGLSWLRQNVRRRVPDRSHPQVRGLRVNHL